LRRLSRLGWRRKMVVCGAGTRAEGAWAVEPRQESPRRCRDTPPPADSHRPPFVRIPPAASGPFPSAARASQGDSGRRAYLPDPRYVGLSAFAMSWPCSVSQRTGASPGCGPTCKSYGWMSNRPLPDDPLWYKDAIIYETHVRTFYDSNNDGIGDFRGLTLKLDYLQQLGVTCIWLLPFFPSPLRDDGYDISDYRDVHPSYGTLDDFRAFLAAAHERQLRVIIELVVNHTSDQHPWFQRARRATPGSMERDYYVWSDTDKKYAGARIIFTDTEKSNWSWDPEA